MKMKIPREHIDYNKDLLEVESKIDNLASEQAKISIELSKMRIKKSELLRKLDSNKVQIKNHKLLYYILLDVSNFTNVFISDVMSNNSIHDVVYSRMLFVYIARHKYGMSAYYLSQYFPYGHSTFIYYLRKMKKLYLSDKNTRDFINTILLKEYDY